MYVAVFSISICLTLKALLKGIDIFKQEIEDIAEQKLGKCFQPNQHTKLHRI